MEPTTEPLCLPGYWGLSSPSCSGKSFLFLIVTKTTVNQVFLQDFNNQPLGKSACVLKSMLQSYFSSSAEELNVFNIPDSSEKCPGLHRAEGAEEGNRPESTPEAEIADRKWRPVGRQTEV
jgi:hypothetical protein